MLLSLCSSLAKIRIAPIEYHSSYIAHNKWSCTYSVQIVCISTYTVQCGPRYSTVRKYYVRSRKQKATQRQHFYLQLIVFNHSLSLSAHCYNSLLTTIHLFFYCPLSIKPNRYKINNNTPDNTALLLLSYYTPALPVVDVHVPICPIPICPIIQF